MDSLNDRERGATAGGSFANDDNDPELVARIAGWYSEIGAAEIDAVFSKDAESNSAFTVAEEAYFAWHHENNGDRAAAIYFWEQQTSMSGLPSPEFVRGFSEACYRHYANLVR